MARFDRVVGTPAHFRLPAQSGQRPQVVGGLQGGRLPLVERRDDLQVVAAQRWLGPLASAELSARAEDWVRSAVVGARVSVSMGMHLFEAEMQRHAPLSIPWSHLATGRVALAYLSGCRAGFRATCSSVMALAGSTDAAPLDVVLYAAIDLEAAGATDLSYEYYEHCSARLKKEPKPDSYHLLRAVNGQMNIYLSLKKPEKAIQLFRDHRHVLGEPTVRPIHRANLLANAVIAALDAREVETAQSFGHHLSSVARDALVEDARMVAFEALARAAMEPARSLEHFALARTAALSATMSYLHAECGYRLARGLSLQGDDDRALYELDTTLDERWYDVDLSNEIRLLDTKQHCLYELGRVAEAYATLRALVDARSLLQDETARAHAEGLHWQLGMREAQVTQRERDLARSRKDDAITRVASGVAHDINGLLMVQSFAIEELDAESEAAQLLSESSRRMRDLVRKLATVGRHSSAPAQMASVCDIVRQQVPLISRIFGQDRAVILTCEEDATVSASPTDVEQVATNLIVNARDAAPDADPRLWVEVHRTLEHVVLVVEDNGPGVPAKLVDRLFDPYVTTKATGTGLGLSIVKGVVVAAGGDVSIQTGRAGGARFVCRFPALAIPSAEGTPSSRSPGPSK